MKTIWKFLLKTTEVQPIRMPKGAKILTVQVQDDSPCLWALVDPHAKPEKRMIEIFGTGHPIQSNDGNSREYIGTYQQNGGQFVGHVFEYTGI